MNTNLIKFETDLDAFSKKIGVSLQLVLKKVSFSIFTSIVRRTPFDTGIARASWVIGVNSFANPADIVLGKGEKLSSDEAAQLSLSRLSAIDITSPFSLVIISNYLPYIQRLEHGWSKKAPAGMVKLAIEEEKDKLRAGIQAI